MQQHSWGKNIEVASTSSMQPSWQQKELSKQLYVRQMYNCIYNTYIAAGIAKPRDSPVYQNFLGDILSVEEKYGECIKIIITNPNTSCLSTN